MENIFDVTYNEKTSAKIGKDIYDWMIDNKSTMQKFAIENNFAPYFAKICLDEYYKSFSDEDRYELENKLRNAMTEGNKDLRGYDIYRWMYDNFSNELFAAKHFGYAESTIKTYLREYYNSFPDEQSKKETKDEVVLRYHNRAAKKAITMGKEIYDWMLKTESTAQQAAEHFNCNVNTIYGRLSKYYKTIPETRLEKVKKDLKISHTDYAGEKYCNYALETGAGYAEIAKHFGIGEAAVKSTIVEYYKTLSPEQTKRLKENLQLARGGEWALMSNEDVYNYALENGYTAPEIAAQFGCSENAVNGKLHKYYDSMSAHDARTKQKKLERARIQRKYKTVGGEQPNAELGKLMYEWALPIAASADEISIEFGYGVSFVYSCFSKYYASFKDRKISNELKDTLNRARRNRKEREFNETGFGTGITPNKPFVLEPVPKPLQDIELVKDTEVTKEQICESKDIAAVIPIGFTAQIETNKPVVYRNNGVSCGYAKAGDKVIKQCVEMAEYYIKHDCSYDDLVEHFGVSTYVIHRNFNELLSQIDTDLHTKVREQTARHIGYGLNKKPNVNSLYDNSINEIRYRMGASKGGVPTKETIEEVVGIATYYLESGCTWRDITDKFKISDYTLNIYFNDLLEQVDKDLYARYKAVTLKQNKPSSFPIPNVIPAILPDRPLEETPIVTVTKITPTKKKTVRRVGFVKKSKSERIG